jgi:hypothetical protein
LAAAGGAIFGGWLQNEIGDKDNKVSQAAAPIAGGIIAGGLYAVGGGALVAAGLSSGLIAIPAAALTAIFISFANGIETSNRAAELTAALKVRDEFLHRHDYQGAWNYATEQWDKGVKGLHFKIDGEGWAAAPETVPATNGALINVRETLTKAYGATQEQVDLERTEGRSQAFTAQQLGDEWATVFEKAVPWVNPGAFHKSPPATPEEARQQINEARADLGIPPIPAPTVSKPSTAGAAPPVTVVQAGSGATITKTAGAVTTKVASSTGGAATTTKAVLTTTLATNRAKVASKLDR